MIGLDRVRQDQKGLDWVRQDEIGSDRLDRLEKIESLDRKENNRIELN